MATGYTTVNSFKINKGKPLGSGSYGNVYMAYSNKYNNKASEKEISLKHFDLKSSQKEVIAARKVEGQMNTEHGLFDHNRALRLVISLNM